MPDFDFFFVVCVFVSVVSHIWFRVNSWLGCGAFRSAFCFVAERACLLWPFVRLFGDGSATILQSSSHIKLDIKPCRARPIHFMDTHQMQKLQTTGPDICG